MEFDPNGPAASDGLFGLPYDYDSSKLVLLPCPWEVTTSYGGGTALGPKTVLQASQQVDLFSRQFGKAYENGYFLEEFPEDILEKNNALKESAQWIVEEKYKENGETADVKKEQEKVNRASDEFNDWVYRRSKRILDHGKICAVLGGDHSTPYGLMRALGEKHQNDYSVLHLDAHHDLREAYQGFTHSHASIFHNVMESAFAPKKLVQVGIRDFCEEEHLYYKDSDRIECFYDRDIEEALFNGRTWKSLCDEIVSKLTDKVYLSTDIDGLNPALCPHTGTPVPGGLSFTQFDYLLQRVAESGKKIIGFDLVEVAPDPQGLSELDGNVGARVLFQLCGWTMKSNGLAD